jgi:hypothetical protein
MKLQSFRTNNKIYIRFQVKVIITIAGLLIVKKQYKQIFGTIIYKRSLLSIVVALAWQRKRRVAKGMTCMNGRGNKEQWFPEKVHRAAYLKRRRPHCKPGFPCFPQAQIKPSRVFFFCIFPLPLRRH